MFLKCYKIYFFLSFKLYFLHNKRLDFFHEDLNPKHSATEKVFIWKIWDFFSLHQSLDIFKQRYSCWLITIFKLLIHNDYRLQFSHRRLDQHFWKFLNLPPETTWYLLPISWKETSRLFVSGGLFDSSKLHYLSCIQVWLSDDSKNR